MQATDQKEVDPRKLKGLRRYYSKYKTRPTAYYDPISGQMFSEVSKVHKFKPHADLADVLATCDCPVLYILPEADGSYPSAEQYYSIPDLLVKKYLSRRKSALIHYRSQSINVYPISTWCDVKPGTSLKSVITGMRALQQEIENLFQPQKVTAGREEKMSIPLLATPSQMGGDLLKRTLPYEQVYEPLPDTTATVILAELGQGRIETFYHGEDSLQRAYDYDARWFYADCIRHVPVGRAVHDTEPEIMDYVTGFYRVNVAIPSDWNHIGLLPCRNPAGSTNKFYYPRAAGSQFESWCTSTELFLAIKNGWMCTVSERILWPDTQKLPEPLKLLAEKLIKLRLEIADNYPDPIVRAIIKAGARNLLLHLIGSLHRVQREYDGYTSDEDTIPQNASSFELLPDGEIWRYTQLDKLSPLLSQMSQPHWPAYVWGLARRKLAEQALKVPFNELVALRVDAVWTSSQQDWKDSGKVGVFRRETLRDDTDLAWPKNTSEMVELVKRCKIK